MALSASISVEGGIESLGAGGPLYRLMVFPFPPNHFMVHSFRGREELSGLYTFDVIVTASDLIEGAIERLALGQRALLVLRAGKASRAFHGVVASVRHEGVRESHGASQYRIRLVPRAWLLKHKRRSRIFQNMRVDEVIAAVLKDVGTTAHFKLKRDYPAREYCTQYEETDYRFLRRLCAESGIFFSYAQSGTIAEEAVAVASAAIGGAAGAVLGAAASGVLAKIFSGETMVFSDSAEAYAPIDDGSLIGAAAEALGAATSASVDIGGASLSVELASPTLYYLSVLGTSTAAFDKVTRFEPTRRIRTNAAMYREYDPERPMAMISTFGQSEVKGAGGAGSAGIMGAASVSLDGSSGLRAEASLDVGGAITDALSGILETVELEHYEHHADYLFPKWRYADDEPALILRQKRRDARVAEGASTCPALAVGHRFRLEDHPVHELNREYAVTAVEHEGWATPPEGQREVYRNRFSSVPAEVAFCLPRPKRRSVMVALTATVAGPPGTEIHTDASGQIKVQFHWDRERRFDEHSSCWIRTMQAWGGPGWGTQFIPRVGMEVVVTFEGGDPDKPMVLGCLYNGTHPPSFNLPENKTRSGIRTQSSPGGGGFNELSFEDLKGEEQIYLHAQRDLDEIVRRDHTITVQHDETSHVHRNRRATVGRDASDEVRGDREEVVRGDVSVHHLGTRTDVVDQTFDQRVGEARTIRVDGRDDLEVRGTAEHRFLGDLTTRVTGNHMIIVGRHDAKRAMNMRVEGPATLSAEDGIEIHAAAGLTLRCGKTSIRIGEDGIEIQGEMVRVAAEEAGVSVDKDGIKLTSKGTYAHFGAKLLVKTEKTSLAMGTEVKVDGDKILLNSPEKATEEPPPEKGPPTDIEIADAEGRPLGGQRFVVLLEDGSQRTGVTDKDGKAKIDLPEGAKAEIRFPELADVERA